MNIYESEKLLGEYLLFHYGSSQEVLPSALLIEDALGYPQRCVSECLDVRALPAQARALDLGCAVGRSSFELARWCTSVIGIDFSQRFIEAAERIRRDGALDYLRTDEGELRTPLIAQLPANTDPARVRFEQGDAMDLRGDLGTFDVVLLANLIDRLSNPRRCLETLPALINPGGQLIITSPYTWLEEFTPRENWLGGFERDGTRVATLDGLRAALEPSFHLEEVQPLPFLIREHARKFQLSIAEASTWRKR
ncbi:MAG TPA: putative 4-mercaptohistidine N1-methyltransferase [Chthoniobacteraceae bacterium]|jgi:putative 4-mercaptohistidine N1-methyltranferase